jgi:hypothetical protein
MVTFVGRLQENRPLLVASQQEAAFGTVPGTQVKTEIERFQDLRSRDPEISDWTGA